MTYSNEPGTNPRRYPQRTDNTMMWVGGFIGFFIVVALFGYMVSGRTGPTVASDPPAATAPATTGSGAATPPAAQTPPVAPQSR